MGFFRTSRWCFSHSLGRMGSGTSTMDQFSHYSAKQRKMFHREIATLWVSLHPVFFNSSNIPSLIEFFMMGQYFHRTALYFYIYTYMIDGRNTMAFRWTRIPYTKTHPLPVIPTSQPRGHQLPGGIHAGTLGGTQAVSGCGWRVNGLANGCQKAIKRGL